MARKGSGEQYARRAFLKQVAVGGALGSSLAGLASAAENPRPGGERVPLLRCRAPADPYSQGPPAELPLVLVRAQRLGDLCPDDLAPAAEG